METPNHVWSPAPEDLKLAANEVDVWRAQLELPSSNMQGLKSTLTDDELERAKRFSFETDRQLFIAARGILRSILSRYITIHPDNLRFYYNQYGKPYLDPEINPDLLNFNLSHCGGLALYAIARNREVGVDVERVRSDFQFEEIAKRFFSLNELAVLSTTPAEKRLEAFYTLWTRKEAFIKANGKGLSLPLESFDVSLTPGESPVLSMIQDGAQERPPLTLVDVEPGPGFRGALAVQGMGCTFRYWEWGQS